MRVIAGIILGVVIFFPGIALLQWVGDSLLGLYHPITFTDGCLVMIIILLSILIFTGVARNAASASSPRWELTGSELEDEAPSLRRRRRTQRQNLRGERVDITSVPGRPRSGR